ncbi:MAG: PHP domain-containing protein [Deltaproteobacteria bacterium]|nr:PHP domain-containing protein [Deltaproteobacteria bacterium]
MRRLDLHVHSTASDGTLTPRELVLLAKRSNLAGLGLCDHDTVDGLAEFWAAGADYDFPVVGGVELSLNYQRITHLLGLGVACGKDSPPRLEALQRWRLERNQKLLGKLEALGVKLSWERIEAIAGGGQPGKPHFARAMLELGYVSSLQEAFDKFMGKGRPAYVEKARLSPPEAIELLRDKGFAPVLAHPVSLGLRAEEWLKAIPQWADWGLAGLEAYHPDHSPAFAAFIALLADKHGLVATAGSDYHGANKATPITWTRDNSPLGLSVVEALRQKLGPGLRAG